MSAGYHWDRSHYEVLRKKFSVLRNTIYPNRIIDYVYAKSVLDRADYEDITRMDTTMDKVEMLLLYLMRKSTDCYIIFLEALKNNSHQDVADVLQVTQLIDKGNLCWRKVNINVKKSREICILCVFAL